MVVANDETISLHVKSLKVILFREYLVKHNLFYVVNNFRLRWFFSLFF